MEYLSHTAQIYGLIAKEEFREAVGQLQEITRVAPANRAALSLLGYCFYHLEEYEAASRTYGTLAVAYPDVEQYHQYWCQSLFKAGMLADAARAAGGGAANNTAPILLALLSAIRLEQGDLKGCRQTLDTLGPGSAATGINLGCLFYREGKWAAAAARFSEALQTQGYSPELVYSLAVCQYQQRDFGAALGTITDIIELGVYEHPELGVGSAADGLEVCTVGNSTKLRQTALVEAFNLKAAIELELRNVSGAAAALADMPPRKEHELDPVTLHNQALVSLAQGSEAGTDAGLDKLAHLLAHPPFPPEVVGNLLSLCCRSSSRRPALAEEVLASHPELVAVHLAPETAAFYQACAARARSAEGCEAALDSLARQHVESLRRLVKQVQDARWANDQEAAAAGLAAYEAALESFIPVLMTLANLHWEAGHPARAQDVLQTSAEFCGDHATWRLNLAHMLVAQDGARLADAAELYESILQHFVGARGGPGESSPAGGAGSGSQALHAGSPAGGEGGLLEVPPSALANLCVCYVILSQNEVAEDLLRRLEDATAAAQAAGLPLPPPPHLSLANLAIGTLYCSKGNYEFGITRIMRALEPLSANLDTARWRAARLCFLGMLDHAAKQLLQLKDAMMADLLAFLEDVEEVGRCIPASIAGGAVSESGAVPTIRAEARAIHAVLLKMCD